MSIRSIIFVAALATVLSACAPTPSRPSAPASAKGGGGESAPRPQASPTPSELTLGTVTYNNFGERDMRRAGTRGVDAGEFYFKGTFLRGQPGETLTLKVKNTGTEAHNFSLPEQRLDIVLPVGAERMDVDVRVPESGALRFFCKLHTDKGMNGQLLAGDAQPQPLAAAPQPSGG